MSATIVQTAGPSQGLASSSGSGQDYLSKHQTAIRVISYDENALKNREVRYTHCCCDFKLAMIIVGSLSIASAIMQIIVDEIAVNELARIFRWCFHIPFLIASILFLIGFLRRNLLLIITYLVVTFLVILFNVLAWTVGTIFLFEFQEGDRDNPWADGFILYYCWLINPIIHTIAMIYFMIVANKARLQLQIFD